MIVTTARAEMAAAIREMAPSQREALLRSLRAIRDGDMSVLAPISDEDLRFVQGWVRRRMAPRD